MKMNSTNCCSIKFPPIFIGLMLVYLVSGCSSGSSTAVELTSTAALGASVKNVPLTSGVPQQIRFTFTIPGDISAKGDASINISNMLQSATLSAMPIASTGSRFETLKFIAYAMVKEAFAVSHQSTQITAYVSFAGDPNVCTSPYSFGPYTINGLVGSALTSGTSSVTPSSPAVDIMNSGSLEICVITIPPVTAFLTVPDVTVDFEPCAQSSANIVGTWAGTFQCTNFGTPDDPTQAISLTITQNPDGSFQYIDGGGAVYNGHLCGDKFKFNGSLPGFYTESGSFVFNGNNASKTSNWLSTITNTIGGRCSDSLQKT